MKKRINEIVLIIYGLIYRLFNRLGSSTESKGKVLIAMDLGFGDAILFVNCFRQLVDFYGKERVVFLGLNRDISFYKTIPELKSIEYIGLEDSHLSTASLRTLLGIQKKINRMKYEVVINVYAITLLLDMFLIGAKSERIITISDTYGSKKFLRRMVRSLVYTSVIYVDSDDMMFRRYAILYKEATTHKMIVDAPKDIQNAINKSQYNSNYIVVSPGSSSLAKCWSVNKFSIVIEYIIKKTNYNIYITGDNSKVDMKQNEDLMNILHSNNRVMSFVGKQNYNEWFSMIRGARAVIGNDTGIIHLASYVNVPDVIVIGGYYGGYSFLPYDVDEPNSTRMTVIRAEEMKCKNCKQVDKIIGSNSNECMKEIDNGKEALCVRQVDVNSVIQAIIDSGIINENKN